MNGQRVTIPSFRVRVGDAVTLANHAQDDVTIRQNLDLIDRPIPGWIEADESGRSLAIRALPEHAQIDTQVREQLIVELYSK